MTDNNDWHAQVYKKTLHVESGLEAAEWRLLRDEVLRRDKWTCQRCERKFRAKKYITAHHIVPRANDGPNTMENLITLCASCHDYVEQQQFRNKSDIIGSLEEPQKENMAQEEYNNEDWHSWVYGGTRNPYMDRPRNAQKW